MILTMVYDRHTVVLDFVHRPGYLSFNSNHSLHVKRGLVQSFHRRVPPICQEREDFNCEISSLRRDLHVNGYL
jgi:hypothetical protein